MQWGGAGRRAADGGVCRAAALLCGFAPWPKSRCCRGPLLLRAASSPQWRRRHTLQHPQQPRTAGCRHQLGALQRPPPRLHTAATLPAPQLCIVNLDGTVERQWRIQRVQEVLVAKGGRYILVSPLSSFVGWASAAWHLGRLWGAAKAGCPPHVGDVAPGQRRERMDVARREKQRAPQPPLPPPSLNHPSAPPPPPPPTVLPPPTPNPRPQATTCERKVRVYDLQADTESHIPEAEPLISMSMSRDGRYLLANLTSNCMHLWDCGTDRAELRVPAMPAATYRGPSVSLQGWGSALEWAVGGRAGGQGRHALQGEGRDICTGPGDRGN